MKVWTKHSVPMKANRKVSVNFIGALLVAWQHFPKYVMCLNRKVSRESQMTQAETWFVDMTHLAKNTFQVLTYYEVYETFVCVPEQFSNFVSWTIVRAYVVRRMVRKTACPELQISTLQCIESRIWRQYATEHQLLQLVRTNIPFILHDPLQY